MDSFLIIGIGLLGLGVLLIVLESFVPSGGILGISSVISTIAGIVYLFKYETIWGSIGLLGAAILGPMIFVFSIKMLPSTPLGRSMLGRSGEEIAQQRFESNQAQRSERDHLLGLEGEAATDMRPSGVVVIDGIRHDAIATGGIVNLGEHIRITKVDGLTIEVRRFDA
ncbi:MAG: hypothetical protein JKX70_06325 [Phycisphaerales bacterium]|nr:hypothetical protein [Phycisphaerales bacterium]